MSHTESKMLRNAIGLVGIALLWMVLPVPAAHAAFGIQSVGGAVTLTDGAPATQAGAHPDQARIALRFNRHDGGPVPGMHLPDGDVRDVSVDLPPGFIGNPTAVPQCDEDLVQSVDLNSQCPAISQVGVAINELNIYENPPLHTPVYNMKPPRGMVAQFAFNIAGVIAHFDIRLRDDGSYGVTIDSDYLSQALGVLGADVRLWGVPSAPDHDGWRVGDCLSQAGPTGVLCPSQGAVLGADGAPFLTNPTDCSAGPLTTTVRVRSWQEPDVWHTASFDRDLDGVPMQVEGCDRLAFEPLVDAGGITTAADAPTGMDLDLRFGQAGLNSERGLAAAPLKKAVVTLPDGMTINPAAAGGLQACTDDQLNQYSSAPVTCPEASKIGTVTASTPLLRETVEGAVYIGSQKSSDPESGEMFRLFLNLVNRERGIDVKLRGGIRADKDTGRLVATFDNNPQLPVDDIKLSFKSGPRAPLATPATCGNRTVDAELTSWAGHDVTRQSGIATDCTAGLGGLTPAFAAGSDDARAGIFAPFRLTIAKPDGNAAIAGLSMVLPAGLVARVAGNLGTQVGTVKAYAGPGSNPFMLPGQVFLEGPYGDAPFSLRVVVPAVAGPFDLGTVTVRQKIYVDPVDAHVTVVSDPLPTIVGGVPVRLQRLDVAIDKPGFMINPTSCAGKTISGTLGAADGRSVPMTTRFQVGDCATLDLKPKLSLSLTGKGQTTDNKHPALKAALTMPAGGANLKKVTVTLPLSMALDPDHAASDTLCEFTVGQQTVPVCPASSIVGTATARTPILDEPLSGPVYFVKNVRIDAKSGRPIKTLPTLVIPLRGQGVTLVLRASSAVTDDHLVTTFDSVPDAPVSDFKLNLDGGSKGILVVSNANLCAATQVAEQVAGGQNGKSVTDKITMATPCALGVVASSHTASALKLTVGGIGAGTVSVSGHGLTKTSRTIGRATTATLAPRLSKATHRALAHHRNVRVRVTVSFRAKGTKKAKTTHKTLTIHGAARSR
jgi:hypothetical protein